MINTMEYKGLAALIMENAEISAVIVPGLGAKLVSLYSKKTKREFLYQKRGDKPSIVPYAGDYLQSEMCGMDDMFPNIDAGFYMKYPWRGTELPDHGEVWSLDWKYEIQNEKIICGVWGVRFPYHLQKSISIKENCV